MAYLLESFSMFAPAGMLRNRVPEWIRMGGRNQSESGAGLGRNLHIAEINILLSDKKITEDEYKKRFNQIANTEKNQIR